LDFTGGAKRVTRFCMV